jgi:hypothetical protein
VTGLETFLRFVLVVSLFSSEVISSVVTHMHMHVLHFSKLYLPVHFFF